MIEARRHRRLKLPLQVAIEHPSIGLMETRAGDMSDGGMFLLLADSSGFETGQVVHVRTLGLGPEGKDSGPRLAMQIVRKTDRGVGLQIHHEANAADTDHGAALTSVEITEPPVVLQKLFLMNEHKQVLALAADGGWRLPARALTEVESWDEGIQHCLEDLQQLGALPPTASTRVSRQCYPDPGVAPPSLEMIIPARVRGIAPEPPASDHGADGYCWLDGDGLQHRMSLSAKSPILDLVQRL